MEDAPSKPNPTGLMMAIDLIEKQTPAAGQLPVIYAGDTAADMQTITAAVSQYPNRQWLAVGILPPHAQKNLEYQKQYAEKLKAAGAVTVLDSVRSLDAECVKQILSA